MSTRMEGAKGAMSDKMDESKHGAQANAYDAKASGKLGVERGGGRILTESGCSQLGEAR